MTLCLYPLCSAASAFPQAASANASSTAWNGWIFRAPDGWQAQATPEAYVLRPSASSATNEVRLLPAELVSSTLEQWFPTAVQQQSGTLRGFRAGAIKQAKTAEGIPYLYLTGRAINQQGVRVVVSYTGMLSRNGQGLLFAAQFDTFGALRYLGAYGQFVKSIEPGDAPASATGNPARAPRSQTSSAALAQQDRPAAGAELAPAATNAPPATPNGHDLYDWFGNFYNSVMPGPNFTISTSMVWTFYRFFPNGYLYEGLPSNVDPAAINCPAVVRGGKCKRYSLSGGTLTIEGEKPHTFARDGNNIKIDGTTENRVRRADRPMNGTWKTSSGGGLGTTVTLSQHLLTLRPDGTFSLNGSTGVSGANVAGYGSSASTGHYKTSGYTIELDYANGRVTRQSFLLPYPDDKVFLIGESMYFTPSR